MIPAVLLAGCNEQNEFEPFRVKAFSCNKVRASIDETLTLNWDYGRPELLKMQKLRFQRLHLSGIAQDIVDLDLDQRSFTFTFNGPITVEVQATVDEVTEEQPFAPTFSAALTVNTLRDLFLRATFQSGSDTPNSPYLGYPQDNQTELLNEPVTVEFTQFAGFFDDNGNGRIDPLVQFMPGTEAFRALSTTGKEEEDYGFREGPSFPFQLFSTPILGRTNGMIYAGAIVMNGQDLPYKADDADGIGRVSVNTGQGSTTAALTFDPIFVGIPLLEAGQLTMADIQLGNLNQKLIATVFTNELQTAASTLGSINALTVNRATRSAVGNIKGAVVGITVSPEEGDVFDAIVNIESLEWETEYMRDQDLMQVLTFG